MGIMGQFERRGLNMGRIIGRLHVHDYPQDQKALREFPIDSVWECDCGAWFVSQVVRDASSTIVTLKWERIPTITEVDLDANIGSKNGSE
jgi:hypothetical protein